VLLLGLVWMPTNDCSGEWERNKAADWLVLISAGAGVFGCLGAALWFYSQEIGRSPQSLFYVPVYLVGMGLLVYPSVFFGGMIVHAGGC